MDNTAYTKFYEENKVETPSEVEVATTTTTAGSPVEVTALPPEASIATSGYVEVVDEPEVLENQEEKIEEPKELIGVVDNCARLRVRTNPTPISGVLKIVNVGAKVKILGEAGEDFYKVQVAGVTGFCMKEYITVE